MQEKLVIRINTKNRKELLYGIVFILPYFEAFIGGTWRIGKEAVGRAIIVAECIIIVATILNFLFYRRKMRSGYTLEILFFFYIIAMTVINTSLQAKNISTALWMGIPIVCALLIQSRITVNKLDYNKVLYYGVLYFTGYAVLLCLYNIFVLDVLKTGNRITALAGGPVIFGYTLAVYFAVVITNKQLFSNKLVVFFKIAFSIIAIMTGSRGGVWPIIVLWIFDFVYSKFTYKRLAVSVLIMVALVIVNPVNLIYQIMPRLLDSSDLSRLGSTYGALRVFQSSDIRQALFGRGPGECFPYQAWVNRNVVGSTIFGNSNNFYINGSRLLVQPHNSYIYFLLELGIIGVFFVLAIFIKNAHFKTKENRIERVLLLGTIGIVNLLDSVFIVEPGVGLIMWLLVFYSSSMMTKSQ